RGESQEGAETEHYRGGTKFDGSVHVRLWLTPPLCAASELCKGKVPDPDPESSLRARTGTWMTGKWNSGEPAYSCHQFSCRRPSAETDHSHLPRSRSRCG